MCLSVWNNNALYWCFRSIVWIFVLIKAALLIFCCIAKKEKLFSLHQVFLWSIPIKDIPAKIELLSRILSPGYILQVLLFFETHCCHGNYWLQRTNALITFLKPLSILAKKGIQILMKKKWHDNKQQDNNQRKRVVYYFRCHEDFCDIWSWTALAQEATTILLCDICLGFSTRSENLHRVQYHSLAATSNLLLER